jgi:hypothetical protein
VRSPAATVVYPARFVSATVSAAVSMLNVIGPAAGFTARLLLHVSVATALAGRLALSVTVSTAPALDELATVIVPSVPTLVIVHVGSPEKMSALGVTVTVVPLATWVVGVKTTIKSPGAAAVTRDVPLEALPQVTEAANKQTA